MDRPPKNILKNNFRQKIKKETFFGAIYQLKNTSDCIKIDPRGPGRNLKKSQKKSKKLPNILGISCFWCKNMCFWVIFGYAQKGAPFRGALGRAPLPFVERKY